MWIATVDCVLLEQKENKLQIALMQIKFILTNF